MNDFPFYRKYRFRGSLITQSILWPDVFLNRIHVISYLNAKSINLGGSNFWGKRIWRPHWLSPFSSNLWLLFPCLRFLWDADPARARLMQLSELWPPVGCNRWQPIFLRGQTPGIFMTHSACGISYLKTSPTVSPLMIFSECQPEHTDRY